MIFAPCGVEGHAVRLPPVRVCSLPSIRRRSEHWKQCIPAAGINSGHGAIVVWGAGNQDRLAEHMAAETPSCRMPPSMGFLARAPFSNLKGGEL